jgi:signal transduction histidine kinase
MSSQMKRHGRKLVPAGPEGTVRRVIDVQARAATVKRWWNTRPLQADATLAVVLFAASVVGVAVQHRVDTAFLQPDAMPIWVAAVWSAVLALPLALRRRFPVASALWISVIYCGRSLADVPEQSIASMIVFISFASVGVNATPALRNRVRAFSVMATSVVLVILLARQDISSKLGGLGPMLVGLRVITNVLFYAAAWLLGDAFRGRLEREAALVERTCELEAERAENARRAVTEERLRIARELHDVVAHHVSVMGVQAGAARHVLGRHPDQAGIALGVIESSSRHAVDELRRLVGLLRDDELDSLEPPPGLARIDELLTDARSTGLTICYTVTGTQRPVPASVELSVYRIIQEALTNTRKHARATNATIQLVYSNDGVEVSVTDNGTPPTRAAASGRIGTGHGIIGMRERTEMHGGNLHAGPIPSGFAVTALLPTRAIS